ncbi:protein of unknown function [Streptomyces murinus]
MWKRRPMRVLIRDRVRIWLEARALGPSWGSRRPGPPPCAYLTQPAYRRDIGAVSPRRPNTLNLSNADAQATQPRLNARRVGRPPGSVRQS